MGLPGPLCAGLTADIVFLSAGLSWFDWFDWFDWDRELLYECRTDTPLFFSTLLAAARVCLVADCGCSSKGIAFVREDFLLPSLTNEAGPSTAIFLQGGDMCRGNVFEEGVVSVSFRFFAGGPPSWSCAASSFLVNCAGSLTI